MAKTHKGKLVDPDRLAQQVFIIRGQRVMLDSDLAELYGVTVGSLNQAVKRNRDRFPSDFAHQLTAQELTNLKSQIVISSSAHGGKRTLPWVFTEHGVAMLSSVLRSPRAVQVNIEIICEHSCGCGDCWPRRVSSSPNSINSLKPFSFTTAKLKPLLMFSSA